MLYLNYKTTLKNIVRSPAALLGLVGGIMLIIINGGIDTGDLLGSESMRLSAYAQAISGNIRGATTVFLPAFIGIVIACDMYEEQKNRVCDLLFGGRMNFCTFYVSKIFAYATVSLIGCAVFTLCATASLASPRELNLGVSAWHIIKMYAVRIFYFYTGGIISYLSVAVFFAAVFGRGAFAAVFCILYERIYYVAMSFFRVGGFGGGTGLGAILPDYVLHVPYKIDFYVHFWGSDQVSMLSNRTEALKALGAQVAVGLILLIAAGVILRKRLKK